MLKPEFLRNIVDGAVDVVAKLRSAIISKIIDSIINRLERGDDYILTPKNKYMIEALEQAGVLREDILREIENYTPYIREQILDAFKEAGVEAFNGDSELFKTAGADVNGATLSPKMQRYLEVQAIATHNEFINLTRTTADSAQSLFISACDKAVTEVQSGAVSLEQAVREAIDEASKQGGTITYTKTDENGAKKVHRESIEVAIARAVRTGVAQSTAEITLGRMAEMGWDCVLVSAHLGARCEGGIPENHELWQGKFYHLDWSKMREVKPEFFEKYGAVSVEPVTTRQLPDFFAITGYGTGEGLCGWNCRHSFGPGDGEHNPYDLNVIDTEENRKIYELTQKQRAMERAIRKQKRNVMATEKLKDQSPEDFMRWQTEKKKLANMNKQYKQYCADNGLKTAQDRLYVPKETGNGEINREFEGISPRKAKPKPETIAYKNNYSVAGDKKKKEKSIEKTEETQKPRIAKDITSKYKNKNPKPGVVNNTREENKKDYADIAMANLMAEKVGGEINILEVIEKEGEKQPDYLWDNKYWENKSASSKSTIDSRFRTANKQLHEASNRTKHKIGGVILDLSNYSGDINQGIKEAQELALSRLKGKQKIIIVKDNDIVYAFSINKEKAE